MITATRTSTESSSKKKAKTAHPDSHVLHSTAGMSMEMISAPVVGDNSSLAALAAIAAMTSNNSGSNTTTNKRSKERVASSLGGSKRQTTTCNNTTPAQIAIKISLGESELQPVNPSDLHTNTTTNRTPAMAHPEKQNNNTNDSLGYPSPKLAVSYIASNAIPMGTERPTSPLSQMSDDDDNVPESSTASSSNSFSIATQPRGRKRSSSGLVASDLGSTASSLSLADEAALKRAKNTEAARRSRQRKAQKMESLEKDIIDLKEENTRLQTRVAVLETEKASLKEKSTEKDLRIRQLEQKLAEAFDRLVEREGGQKQPKEKHSHHHRDERIAVVPQDDFIATKEEAGPAID